MNRIICDICGSEYSESADRCPICSYTRQGTEKVVLADADQRVRTKVKGGRYSTKNVKKRQKAMQKQYGTAPQKDPNRPLLITIAVLLLAIMLVSAYIGIRFFRGRDALGTTAPQTTAQPTGTTLPPEIPCEGIEMDLPVVDLEVLNEQKQLEYRLLPENTTDQVTFVSADDHVVRVDTNGLLTAVGSGQTTVRITCGEQTLECTVVCWFEEETTAPPETESAPAQASALTAELTLSHTDASLFSPGEAFTITVTADGQTVSGADVTWTSSDSGIATVKNGLVTGVSKGVVNITASYGGQEAVCIVRCQFPEE